MSFSRVLLAAAVALALLAPGASAQACGPAELLAFKIPLLQYKTSALLGGDPVVSLGLAEGDLPVARPQQPWPYRALASALDAPRPTTDPAGVTRVVLVHQPLEGVTSAMMQWWFSLGDLDVVAPYAGAAGAPLWPLYLQWHARDHCHQFVAKPSPSTGGPGVGAAWQLQEFLMASRNFTRGDSAGFREVEEAQLNLQLTPTRIDEGGLRLEFNPLGSLGGLPALTVLTHEWRDSPAGLELRSTFTVGDESALVPLNRIANCAFSRGADPLEVAAKWQQHSVEEFGNLPKILPGLYAIRDQLLQKK